MAQFRNITVPDLNIAVSPFNINDTDPINDEVNGLRRKEESPLAYTLTGRNEIEDKNSNNIPRKKADEYLQYLCKEKELTVVHDVMKRDVINVKSPVVRTSQADINDDKEIALSVGPVVDYSKFDWDKIFLYLAGEVIEPTTYPLFFNILLRNAGCKNPDHQIKTIELDTGRNEILKVFRLLQYWKQGVGSDINPNDIEKAFEELNFNIQLEEFRSYMREPPLLNICHNWQERVKRSSLEELLHRKDQNAFCLTPLSEEAVPITADTTYELFDEITIHRNNNEEKILKRRRRVVHKIGDSLVKNGNIKSKGMRGKRSCKTDRIHASDKLCPQKRFGKYRNNRNVLQCKTNGHCKTKEERAHTRKKGKEKFGMNRRNCLDNVQSVNFLKSPDLPKQPVNYFTLHSDSGYGSKSSETANSNSSQSFKEIQLANIPDGFSKQHLQTPFKTRTNETVTVQNQKETPNGNDLTETLTFDEAYETFRGDVQSETPVDKAPGEKFTGSVPKELSRENEQSTVCNQKTELQNNFKCRATSEAWEIAAPEDHLLLKASNEQNRKRHSVGTCDEENEYPHRRKKKFGVDPARTRRNVISANRRKEKYTKHIMELIETNFRMNIPVDKEKYHIFIYELITRLADRPQKQKIVSLHIKSYLSAETFRLNDGELCHILHFENHLFLVREKDWITLKTYVEHARADLIKKTQANIESDFLFLNCDGEPLAFDNVIF